MESLELRGNNLGEKHKHYNELLKTAIEEYPLDLSPIDYHDSDINNMLKIDVAHSRKNIIYIIKVLKCKDMFYVNKAIKKLNWILTNDDYATMFDPKYLHIMIFPEMTVKARIKLLLYIRLNIKNETRVEEFFDFFKDIYLPEALKWLPNCSHSFIENAIKTYNVEINVHILKCLFAKSVKFLTTYLNCVISKRATIQPTMEVTTFLMNNHLEEYLDILESLEDHEFPTFNAKHTKILMKKAPHIVLTNFVKYARSINLQTFAKYVQPEAFLIDILLSIYDKNKAVPWFNENALDIFFTALPKKKISEFVKKNVFEKTDELKYFMFLAIPRISYRWYKYVDFKTAFEKIPKLIKTVSSPKERMMMMEVLLFSAKNNMQHIEELLQYFRANHINETLLYKKDFIIHVFKQVDTFHLSNQAWENICVLYLSIEDMESDKKEQRYIKALIIRKIINNEDVPEVLEKSFIFETMKLYRNKLNGKECDMIFNYLYSYAIKQVNLQDISNEMEFKSRVTLLKKVLLLLSDWEKDLAHFPEVVEVITKLIDLKKNQFKDVDLSSLYKVNKSWRKELFTMSLDLSLSQKVCINVLKHDSKLLIESNHFKELLECRDLTNLQKLLNMIRIYWPTSLAKEAISFCLHSLNNRGDKALIKHIMYLLPVTPLKDIVAKYIPNEEIIDWNEDNKLILNTIKNIAKYMHIARPQPPIEFALWYAKGDYLQFTVSSLNSMLYNMSEANARTCIKQLLDAPVSLQKYFIRMTINKLKCLEIIQIFRKAWKITQNKSIRADLFKTTFRLLRVEKSNSAINSLWELLLFFIQSLTDNENTEIYDILTKAEEVPRIIQADFWSTSVMFFKCLQTIPDHKYYISKVLYSANNCLDIVNTKTLAEILLENIQHDILEMDLDTQFIARCILHTKTMETSIHRYHAIMIPIMENCVTYWDVEKDNKYIYRLEFECLLVSLCKIFTYDVLLQDMIYPDDLFTNILRFMEQKIPNEQNYTFLMTWKLSCKLINIIKIQKGNCGWETENCNFILSKAAPQLGEEIQKYLREEIEKYFPSIYICISNAVHSISCNFNFSNFNIIVILKSILCVDLKESYLLALELMPRLEIIDNKATSQILKIISLHPSKEVKLHYHNRRNSDFYRIRNDLMKLPKGVEMKPQVYSAWW